MKTGLPIDALPSRQRVLEDVKQIVAESSSVSVDQIHETSDLLADLACDSLEIVEIVMEVEEHFDVSVPDKLEQEIRTVADIADGVLRLLGAAESRRPRSSLRP
jgi:acyl carrier protein